MGGIPAAADVSAPSSEDEVKSFFDEYTSRYMGKDIEGFMALFSKEAVENRMLPYADIRELYHKTFANSDSLRYHLKVYTIQPFTHRVLVRGRYEILQNIKGKNRLKTFSGDIQWNLIRENGSLKIMGINYGRKQLDD
jgi:hypothetical protein